MPARQQVNAFRPWKPRKGSVGGVHLREGPSKGKDQRYTFRKVEDDAVFHSLTVKRIAGSFASFISIIDIF